MGLVLFSLLLTSAAADQACAHDYYRQSEIFTHAIDRLPLLRDVPLINLERRYEEQSWTGVEIDLREFDRLAFSGFNFSSERNLIEKIMSQLNVNLEVLSGNENRRSVRRNKIPEANTFEEKVFQKLHNANLLHLFENERFGENVKADSSIFKIAGEDFQQAFHDSQFIPPDFIDDSGVPNRKALILLKDYASRESILREALRFMFWRNRENRNDLASIPDLEYFEGAAKDSFESLPLNSPERIKAGIEWKQVQLLRIRQVLGEELDISKFLMDRAQALEFNFMQPTALISRYELALAKMHDELMHQKHSVNMMRAASKKLSDSERELLNPQFDKYFHSMEIAEDRYRASAAWFKRIKKFYHMP